MERKSVVALLVLSCLFARHAGAQARTTLRLAASDERTEAAYRAWADDLRPATSGAPSIEVTVTRHEGDTLQRVRSGQLDGAFLTDGTLASVAPAVLALEATGAVRDRARFDAAAAVIEEDVRAQLDANGLVLVRLVDVESLHLFSTSALDDPYRLRGARAWIPVHDVVARATIEAIGAPEVPIGPNGLDAALASQRVDLAIMTAERAHSLRNGARLRFVTREPISITVGATVISRRSLDALPARARDAVLSSAEVAHRNLRERSRLVAAHLHRVCLRASGEEWPSLGSAWDPALDRARRALLPRGVTEEQLAAVSRVGRSGHRAQSSR